MSEPNVPSCSDIPTPLEWMALKQERSLLAGRLRKVRLASMDEISRLERVLHKYKMHPDWEYTTTMSARKGDGNYPEEGDGGPWLENAIIPVRSGGPGFEEHWHRKKVERPLPSQEERDEETDANNERAGTGWDIR